MKPSVRNNCDLMYVSFVVEAPFTHLEIIMAKKSKTFTRREYTKEDVKTLRSHSKARTPVAKIAKQMKRTEGSLRQKARVLGFGLGHQR